ncbi:hypothetical protein Lepto7375DRAFT_2473 [Leptolyngbya sp. PCC 7375]|nr:hypothetical protein Lepto7375DRAFT_2473 [Leptolyngbya sp. PCC 7375]
MGWVSIIETISNDRLPTKPIAQSTLRQLLKRSRLMGRASIIEAYIQRLLELNQPVTPAILEAIAKEVGITKGEIEAINVQVKGHLSRGQNYIEFGYLDKALDEFNQAKALNPISLDVLFALVEIYNLRYKQDSGLEDRQEAIRLAKRCIELQPQDKEAQALVRSLRRNAIPEAISLQSKPNIFILIGFLENVFSPKMLSRRTKTKIALLILFLQQPIRTPNAAALVSQLALLVGSVGIIGIGFMSVSRLPVFSDTIVEIDPEDTFSNTAGPTTASTGSYTFDPGPNVPVAFNYPGLLIEPRLSRLGEYKGEPYYKLHGIVINDSGQEVIKLDLKVELLDGNGLPISIIHQVSVTDTNTIIRPGDTQSFRLFHKITPDLMSVRVTVNDIQQVVGLTTYEPPSADSSTWSASVP